MAATLKDIARETGLSIATISKYINGANLKEQNRLAIERAIKKLGYTVNEYARGLKSNKSRTVGVIIPELSNLFITAIITRIEEILRSRGYSIIICDCHSDEELECDGVRFLLSKMVDGIINMPVCKDGRHLKPAVERGTPVVLIDRPLPVEIPADCVLIDNAAAAHAAVQYLLSCGHEKIGIVVGPEGVYTSKHRETGYLNALTEQGIAPNSRLIVHSDYTLHGGYQALEQLVENNPDMTALFVTNYEMTLGAMIAANERRICIPDALSFIGFDNLDLSRIANPRLSIVTQPLVEIGDQVARVMLERLTAQNTGVPLTITLAADLVHGDSVKPLQAEYRRPPHDHIGG